MAAALLRGAAVSACATARFSVAVACAGLSALARFFSVAGFSVAAAGLDAPRALRAEAALRAGAAVPRFAVVARSAAFDLVRARSVVCAAVRAPLDLDVVVADLAVAVLAEVALADVLEAAVFAVLAAAAFTVRLSAPAFDLALAPALLAFVLLALVLPSPVLAAALAVRDRLVLASASLAPRFALAGALRFFADFLLEGIRGYSSSCPAVETGRKATRPGGEATPRPG